MHQIPISAVGDSPAAILGASSFHCTFLADTLTLLSDGNVTCGFDDPFGTRSYGNVATHTIREMFNSDAVRERRENLRKGVRCVNCQQYSTVASMGGAAALPPVPDMPRGLIIETTIRCNLRCRNVTCDVNNDRHAGVRKDAYLSFDLFRKAVDEIGPGLRSMWFFNYGEPFLHPRAVDMLEYARAASPGVAIATSTNGLLLGRGDTARRIVDGGLLQYMNFTIAGSDDPTYQIYHKGGSFEQAIEGMRAVIGEKRRLGRELPMVQWRYLLFNWNDGDDEIARAREIAAEIGVDKLAFFLCSSPLGARSRRRAPGTPGHAAIADCLDSEVHYRADPFGDAGLYWPEHDERLGAYCWTGQRAVVKVTPRGRRARVHLAQTDPVARASHPVKLKTPWGEQAAEIGVDAWRCNEIEVPEGREDAPFELEISMKAAYLVARHNREGGSRELGVMISTGFADEPQRLAPLAFESGEATVRGLTGAATIWAEGGEYAINDGEFTTDAGIVFDGDRIRANEGARLVVAGETLVHGSAAPPRNARPTSSAARAHLEREPIPAFVARLHRGLLGRDPEAKERDWWSAAIFRGTPRAEAVERILDSAEAGELVLPVVRLYLAALQRNPDIASVRAWIARRRSGASLAVLARALAGRGEFRARYEDLPHAMFVDQIHEDLLGRKPGEAERSWQGTREALLFALSESAEFASLIRHRAQATLMFVALLGRSPDPQGFDYWIRRMDAGRRREFIDMVLDPRGASDKRPPLWRTRMPVIVARALARVST